MTVPKSMVEDAKKKIPTKIDAKALLSQNQQTSQINKILKMCMLEKNSY